MAAEASVKKTIEIRADKKLAQRSDYAVDESLVDRLVTLFCFIDLDFSSRPSLYLCSHLAKSVLIGEGRLQTGYPSMHWQATDH